MPFPQEALVNAAQGRKNLRRDAGQVHHAAGPRPGENGQAFAANEPFRPRNNERWKREGTWR